MAAPAPIGIAGSQAATGHEALPPQASTTPAQVSIGAPTKKRVREEGGASVSGISQGSGLGEHQGSTAEESRKKKKRKKNKELKTAV